MWLLGPRVVGYGTLWVKKGTISFCLWYFLVFLARSKYITYLITYLSVVIRDRVIDALKGVACVNGDTSFLWKSETFWLFFRLTPGGQTPQPILTQNGSIDVDSRKDVPFAVKIATFHTPWSPGPLKGQTFANFWT